MKQNDAQTQTKQIELLNPFDMLLSKFLSEIPIDNEPHLTPNQQLLRYLDRVFDQLGIRMNISEEHISRLPQGAYVLITNHQFGSFDNLVVLKLLAQAGRLPKILADKKLKNVLPISKYLFNFDQKNNDIEQAVPKMISHLQKGEMMAMFYQHNTLSSRFGFDKKRRTMSRFVQQAALPVVPMYIQSPLGSNIELLGKLHPLLGALQLTGNFHQRENIEVNISIGKPISAREIREVGDLNEISLFLSAKIVSLGSALKVHHFFGPRRTHTGQNIEQLVAPVSKSLLIQEAKYLQQNFKLFSLDGYDVFCAPASQIPNMLYEIGRLRELTFRTIGEGTNKSIDLDHYDLYYYHLVVWSNTDNCIVGAYRIGAGKEIITQFGIKGFYLRSLFKIDKAMHPLMEQSLEMGRSFVVNEYQRRPLPVFLLWKGILYFLLKNPQYRYLVGPVSISNSFSYLSKGLIVEFIRKNYFDEHWAQYIEPRRKFRLKRKYIETAGRLVKYTQADFKKLDKLIDDVEINQTTPVLLKKYISLNAKIVSFNIDPDFNHCLDGFVLLDLFNVPHDVIQALSKELNDPQIKQRATNDVSIHKNLELMVN